MEEVENNSLNKTSNIQSTRLISLIEFAQQAALLKINPVSNVRNHNFFKFEHELRALPGIRINQQDGEIWVSIPRLFESKPPKPDSTLLAKWIDLTHNPSKEPHIKEFIIEDNIVDDQKKSQTIFFADLSENEKIRQIYNHYIKSKWEPWAAEEKNRRKTIKLYADLFTLKQQLDGSLTDLQMEFVLGMGIALWKTEKFNICFPLVTQLIEIALNESTMSLEIRPRESVEARLELDIYSSLDNLCVPDLEKAYRALVATQTQTFSPFDKTSYEPRLQLAATHLDPKGVFTATEDEELKKLPEPSETLTITDSWVLFARPRSKHPYIQDLENFKVKIASCENIELNPVLKQLFSEPLNCISDQINTRFRGISHCEGLDQNQSGGEVLDLFFPLPFNEEQVNIIQKLEQFPGVVVQGPPGTGKTHTIANIISHYMANGKSILVTSMKKTALSVLKKKLPDPIKALAIDLLDNDQEGNKQFNFSINTIFEELQTLDRRTLDVEIQSCETRLNQLHSGVANADRSINEWAMRSIKPLRLDGEMIYPQDAAREVMTSAGEYEWLDDDISVDEKNDPIFDNEDILIIREARQKLGNDLQYIDLNIENISEAIKNFQIQKLHRDLVGCKKAIKIIDDENIPIIQNFKENVVIANAITDDICSLKAIEKKLCEAERSWSTQLEILLSDQKDNGFSQMLNDISTEIKVLDDERRSFLDLPIILPNDLALSEETFIGVRNLSDGKNAFGITGIFMRKELLKSIKEILILNRKPRDSEDWKHVLRFISLCTKTNEAIIKWNAISKEYGLLTHINEMNLTGLKTAMQDLEIIPLVKRKIELKIWIYHNLEPFIKELDPHVELSPTSEGMDKYYDIFKLNFSFEKHNQLSQEKEIMLDSMKQYSGDISTNILNFIANDLGNIDIPSSKIDEKWNDIINEIKRIKNLKGIFDDVKKISDLISESGATQWANKLKTHRSIGTIDTFLPDNWRRSWRLRRLSNYLHSSGKFDEFKSLTEKRSSYEKQISNTYQEIISKRTWLKLLNNATPTIKSALQAFMAAISKIGKGTGKRAIRYRKDAKDAASVIHKVIPCWIMAHHKISESLPVEFGSFDLAIIDEASQSDLSALPVILRAKKILIVGDDKQVSPEGIGLEEEKVNSLMNRFLSDQIPLYKQAMSPDRSIYDLFKIVFSDSQVALKEHFRCASPIIEYSKREFYNHALKPLRLPKKSERLDPPLIDVLVEDGYRKPNKQNPAEAKFIVDEITKICNDSEMENRTIGVVSLLGNPQAQLVWEMLQKELTPEIITRHQIACGDAFTFQGEERDIMFLSMVVTKEENKANSGLGSEQRFNVAASRARDRMYLVRSIELEELSLNDKLRRKLIEHFINPFGQNEVEVKNLRELCESGFEFEVYDLLTERGYKVTPQVKVGNFRIDMVVEGNNDARLAIECDGDRYHDSSNWENDMNRQRILERAGWKFWRCFASTFVMEKENTIASLIQCLNDHGIEPIGSSNAVSIHSEHRKVRAFNILNDKCSVFLNEEGSR